MWYLQESSGETAVLRESSRWCLDEPYADKLSASVVQRLGQCYLAWVESGCDNRLDYSVFKISTKFVLLCANLHSILLNIFVFIYNMLICLCARVSRWLQQSDTLEWKSQALVSQPMNSLTLWKCYSGIMCSTNPSVIASPYRLYATPKAS